MVTPVDLVLERLASYGLVVKPSGNGYMALCPAHDDRNPSLSIAEGSDGRALLHCQAGCDLTDVLGKLGLREADLFADRSTTAPAAATPLRPLSTVVTTRPVKDYVYTDEAGQPVMKVTRYAQLDGTGRTVGKTFRQSHWTGHAWVPGLDDVTPPLYRLPEVVAAVHSGRQVVVVEGEADADRLAALNYASTTAPMGAGKWREQHTEALRDADVAIIADDDAPGHAHAAAVSAALHGVARSVATYLPAQGFKDVSDQLAAGRDLSALRPVRPEDLSGNRSDMPDVSGAAAVAASGRRVRLTPAADIVPRPVEWLWQDRLPVGEIALTPGRGGIGKSSVHAWLIAQLTRGKLDGVHFGQPKPCMIAAHEDSWQRTIVPRLMAAEADLSMVYRIDVAASDVDGLPLSLPEDLNGLADVVNRMGVALVSVDPLLSAINVKIDSYKERDVRTALEPLSEMADSTGCVILGNAHFNKSSGGDAVLLITGSGAFGHVCRAVLAFAADDESKEREFVISQVKNNLGRLDLPSLRYRIEDTLVPTPSGPTHVGRVLFLGESDRTVHDILGGDSRRGSARDEAARWLADYLAACGGSANALKVCEAGAAVGHARRTLQRCKEDIGVVAQRDGFQGGWVWTLPIYAKNPQLRHSPGVASLGAVGAGWRWADHKPDTQRDDRGLCQVCGEPMILYEVGQTVHPICADMSEGQRWRRP